MPWTLHCGPRPYTDAAFNTACRRLADANASDDMSRAAFAELEMLLGALWDACGSVVAHELRVHAWSCDIDLRMHALRLIDTASVLACMHGGIGYSPYFLFLHPELQFGISGLMWDWAHMYINDGLCDSLIGRTFKVFKSARHEASCG